MKRTAAFPPGRCNARDHGLRGGTVCQIGREGGDGTDKMALPLLWAALRRFTPTQTKMTTQRTVAPAQSVSALFTQTESTLLCRINETGGAPRPCFDSNND